MHSLVPLFLFIYLPCAINFLFASLAEPRSDYEDVADASGRGSGCGAETGNCLLTRYLNGCFNFFFLYFDFLRVCCRLCSCAMHAQGKETNEVRRLYVKFFITKMYTSIDMVYVLYRLYNKSILLNVSQA